MDVSGGIVPPVFLFNKEDDRRKEDTLIYSSSFIYSDVESSDRDPAPFVHLCIQHFLSWKRVP